MRVLHVIGSISTRRGGPSHVIRALARGLSSAGLEVHIATTDDDGESRLSVPFGTPVNFFGASCFYFPIDIGVYTISGQLARWLIRHCARYDVVHVHGLFSFPADCAAFVAYSRRIPYIVRPLGILNHWGMNNRRPLLKRAFLRLINGRLLSGAAAVQYTAELERSEACATGLRHRSAIIPNPLDPALEHVDSYRGRFRRQHGLDSGAPIVLYLSRLHEKKNLESLLIAFGRVRAVYGNAVLVVAGTGSAEYTEALRATSRDAGIADAIIWAGFLEGESKLAALADSDVFALTSFSENFGVSVLEAMACGIPVLVTPGVALSKEVADAGAGLVVEPSPASIAEGALRLVGDSAARQALGSAGRSAAHARFSLEAVTTQLLGLYRAVDTGRGLRRNGPNAR